MQRSHHADPREHRWSVLFCNQHQRLHCGLPFIGVPLRFRQLDDELRGVAERDERLSARQFDRMLKPLIPCHELDSTTPLVAAWPDLIFF